MESLLLNDGYVIPQVGIGTWKVTDDEAEQWVGFAIANGYRLIDTAKLYENEKGVGRAIRDAEVDREELFVTTKLWRDDAGFDSTLRAFESSMSRLGVEYLDLYLIHWPEGAIDIETWRAFVRLQQEGRVRSIGVSNFGSQDIDRIVDATGVIPAINQVELHPEKPGHEIRKIDANLGIVTQSWGPLGRGAHRGASLTSPHVAAVAQKHAKTPAQVILRWHVQLGLCAIPKSVHPERIVENLDVFDFELDDEDMTEIAQLDPSTSTL